MLVEMKVMDDLMVLKKVSLIHSGYWKDWNLVQRMLMACRMD